MAQALQLSRDDGAPLATNVVAIRFIFFNTQSNWPESLYREIDVFGELAKHHQINHSTPE